MRIDIFSDVVCPWCYLGSKRLDAALDEVGRDDIEVHWRAFQLDPGAPVEPRDLRAALEAKYGPGSFDAMTQRLTTLGADVGIDYRFDRALAINTADAHRLVAWAASQGAQEPLVDRLFVDYFTDGRDLSSSEVLVVAAASVGLDAEVAAGVLGSDAYLDEVRGDQAEAHERGISGVPAFVIDDQWVIPGAQDVDRLVQLLGKVRARSVPG